MSRALYIVLFLLLLLFGAVYLGNEQTNKGSVGAKNLTFSNTQTWDTDLYTLLQREQIIVRDAREAIVLPPPLPNDSEEVRGELEYLHTLTTERTPEKIEEIKREMLIEQTPVGPYVYGEITDRDTYPHTRYLFKTVLEEYNPIIMYFKNSFDRVRPSYLDPSLTTIIDIPGHPAYPSGHSSQMHLFAHILSDLDPNNKTHFFETAEAVARNREVAGLHYPSDSEAGKILAEQFYTLLKETNWYTTILENARTEWVGE